METLRSREKNGLFKCEGKTLGARGRLCVLGETLVAYSATPAFPASGK